MNRALLTTFLAALDAQRAVIIEILSAPESRGADLTGRRFGELTVTARTSNRIRGDGKPRAYWRCICSCGKETVARADHLRSGDVKSCGHLLRASRFRREPRPAEQRGIEQRAKRRTRGAHRAQATEFAERLRPLIAQAVDDGCTLRRIADRLNAAGTRARFGGAWTANAVYGVLLRLGLKTRRAKTEQPTALAAEQGAAAPANAASTIEQGEAPAYWSEP